MFHVILFQPEIPPNTGNVIRLCANTGASLHLIEPLGFDLSDRQLNRAGLDYHDLTRVTVHHEWRACAHFFGATRIFAASTRGTVRYDAPEYRPNDAFLFGPETRGLPGDILADFPAERRIRLPMLPQNRSVNLSNTVAVVLYEAWRQCGFQHAGPSDAPISDPD